MMEGRTIEYRPEGGLDYHNSPLMAEIPIPDNYSLHRSIEQLRNGVLDHHRHIPLQLSDFRRYESSFSPEHDMPEVKPSVLRLHEYKAFHEIKMHHNEQENELGQRHLSHEEHNGKGYSAPSTPLSENGGQNIPDDKVGGAPGTGDRRGRKKHISNSPSDFRAPRGATDHLEWGMLESSDHEVFGSKADLQLHTQIHLREAKPYRCTQCPKAFANSSYLAQHSRIHLGIKPYRCEICQRKFTQLSHLQQHIRTHTGDKPYRCTVIGCTKAFSQLSNLQSHSRCHQTDKPFKCNSCYKCFSQEKELLEHIPKHKESKHLKTHICQYCGKSYTQETYLSKHMSKHAERADKRPPIGTLGLAGLNRSLGQPAPAPFADHPYWPKISPDSAAHLSEAMAQAHQAQEANANGYQQAQQPRDNQNGEDQETEQNHHRGFSHHRLNGESGENLVIGRPPSNLSLHLNGGHPASSGTPLSAAAPASSAFTPINSVAPHLNGLHHSQLPQRPYLAYDAFPQSKQHQSLPPTNSFPNQLISLHQIRNYAPGGNLLSSDHFLGHTLGLKEKQ